MDNILLEYVKEKHTNKIKEINIWSNNKDNIILSQEEKIHLVLLLIKHKNAKGHNKVKTLIKTYRKEYEKMRLNKPMEIKLLIIPSTENKLNEFPEIVIKEFNSFINVANETSLL